MATVDFTSSDAFMEGNPTACEHATVEIEEYIEGTYDVLRHGAGDSRGEVFAEFVDGAWQLLDGRRFSDWAVRV